MTPRIPLYLLPGIYLCSLAVFVVCLFLPFYFNTLNFGCVRFLKFNLTHARPYVQILYRLLTLCSVICSRTRMYCTCSLHLVCSHTMKLFYHKTKNTLIEICESKFDMNAIISMYISMLVYALSVLNGF